MKNPPMPRVPALLGERRHSAPPPARSGFALVLSLLLMAFLLMLVVGLSAFVRIESQTAAAMQNETLARQNALLALHVAIGELQRHTGPDQRVTARSGTNGALPAPGASHWYGVWHSQPDSQSPDSFLSGEPAWLVSGSQPDPSQEVPVQNAITLVGDGSLGPDNADSRVVVPAVAVDTRNTGRYAFWMDDFSTKVPLDVLEPDRSNRAAFDSASDQRAARQRAVSAPQPGVAGLDDVFSVWEDPTDPRYSHITSISHSAGLPLFSDSPQAMVETAWNGFHDYGWQSRGVLADVRDGGLKLDLTALFGDDRPIYPNGRRAFEVEHAFRPLYEWNTLASHHNRFSLLWESLRNYYRLYLESWDGRVGIRSALAYHGSGMTSGQSTLGFNDYHYIIGPIPDIRNQQTAQDQNPLLLRTQVELELAAYPATVGGDSTIYLELRIKPALWMFNPYNVRLSNHHNLQYFWARFGFPWNPVVDISIYRNDGTLRQRTRTNLGALVWGGSSVSNPAVEFIRIPTIWNVDSGEYLDPGEIRIYGLSSGANHDQNRSRTLLLSNDIRLQEYAYFQNIGFSLDGTLDDATGGPTHFEWLQNRSGTSPLNTFPWPVYDSATPLSNVEGSDIVEVSVYWRETPSLVNNPAYFGDNFSIGGAGNHFRSIGQFRYRQSELHKLNSGPYTMQLQQLLNQPISLGGYALQLKPAVDGWGQDANKGQYTNPVRVLADYNLRIPNYKYHYQDAGRNPYAYQVFENSPPVSRDYAPRKSDGTEPMIGFWGEGLDSGGSLGGSPYTTFFEIPREPLVSLGQFRHTDLTHTFAEPSYVMGESNKPPGMAGNRVEAIIGGEPFIDVSHYTNQVLWDRYFLSTVPVHPPSAHIAVELTNYSSDGAINSTTPTATQIANLYSAHDNFFLEDTTFDQNYVANGHPLPASRLHYLFRDGVAPVVSGLSGPDPEERPRDLRDYRAAAANLMIAGPLNVNTRSVEAWKAALGSAQQIHLGLLPYDPLNEPILDSGALNNPFTRLTLPNGVLHTGVSPDMMARWNREREFTDSQLSELAQAIVDEIENHTTAVGRPFLNLAEFVNRYAAANTAVSVDDPIRLRGTLQRAIDHTDINTAFYSGKLGFNNPELGGAPDSYARNAPGFLSQGDILTALAPILTARGDTFRIRVYGERTHPVTGKPMAKAYGEALVQRLPDFVDPANIPDEPLYLETHDSQPIQNVTLRHNWQKNTNPDLSRVNERFGRRYQIISFRWLNDDQI